jgi:hypothetical protein
MIRRIAAGLGAVAAVSAVALAIPAAAHAANGVLSIDNTNYNNPSGCVFSGWPKALGITNQTDQVANVYAEPGCRGPVVGVVGPAQSSVIAGASVSIP